MVSNTTLQAVCDLLQKHNSTYVETLIATCRIDDGLSVGESIAIINQHFRDLLGAKPRNTMEARSYLVDDCSLTEWLSLLERGVIVEIDA